MSVRLSHVCMVAHALITTTGLDVIVFLDLPEQNVNKVGINLYAKGNLYHETSFFKKKIII